MDVASLKRFDTNIIQSCGGKSRKFFRGVQKYEKTVALGVGGRYNKFIL
jgi:hypothetical protein